MSRERSRTFDWADPAKLARLVQGLSGLEYLQGVVDGEIPPPPIATLIGFELIEIEPGRATFALDPKEWLYNPRGSVHGGVAATILDACIGTALHSTLAAGVEYTTIDLQTRYVRRMGMETGRVLAEGTVVHSGRRVCTGEGRLFAESTGKLIAHGTAAFTLLQ